MSGIRNNGLCPCHRCLVQKGLAGLAKLGALVDTERHTRQHNVSEACQMVADARREIFDNGYAVDGTKPEAILKVQSLVPIKVGQSQLSLLTDPRVIILH